MQQLDLFSDETGKKLAVIKPKAPKAESKKQVEEEAPAAKAEPGNMEALPETEVVIADEETAVAIPGPEEPAVIPEAALKPGPVKLIKPFSKDKEAEQPSKRGRKSLKEFVPDISLLDIPEDEILFQKQYYPISEVSGWFDIKPSLLRYWENEFDILKPRKNKKGDRLFRPEDVKNLRIIYFLLRQKKYSIEGAKQFLKDNQKKAELQMELMETLTKFRSFLLELKANLGG